ncbi:protein of unknown function [Streptomyces murinus]
MKPSVVRRLRCGQLARDATARSPSPEGGAKFQGRGLGKRAVRALLEQARDQDRWGPVYAFPATGNAASNGICRSLGFRLIAEIDMDFAGRALRSNHWVMEPGRDLV